MSAESDPSQRVVVTGMGCVSPLGMDVESSWQNLVDGKHAIRDIRDDLLSDYPQINAHMGATVDGFDLMNDPDVARVLEKKSLRQLHRSTQFAVWAGAQALDQAGLNLPLTSESRYILDGSQVDLSRVGVSIGTGIGGAELLGPARTRLDAGKPLPPSTILQILPERVASVVSMTSGAQGPVKEVTGACATGNMNIIEASRMIRLGEADVVIAGGTEAQISPEGMALFDGTTALDRGDDPAEVSRPFHAEANGFVMGEGAGVLIMESLAQARKRGAAVLAELVGYGETADADHATLSNGQGATAAIRRAMSVFENRDYGRVYVHAHATGTGGDVKELGAIAAVFDPREVVGITSTKGATGHLLGAASAFESIVGIQALRAGIIPPTLKLDKPIPETEGWEMSPHEATDVGDIDLVVKNAFGFGGLNAVTAYARAE